MQGSEGSNGRASAGESASCEGATGVGAQGSGGSARERRELERRGAEGVRGSDGSWSAGERRECEGATGVRECKGATGVRECKGATGVRYEGVEHQGAKSSSIIMEKEGVAHSFPTNIQPIFCTRICFIPRDRICCTGIFVIFFTFPADTLVTDMHRSPDMSCAGIRKVSCARECMGYNWDILESRTMSKRKIRLGYL